MFLTGTFYHKITNTNGYYGTWPWWAVSVGVFPLRKSTRMWAISCFPRPTSGDKVFCHLSWASENNIRTTVRVPTCHLRDGSRPRPSIVIWRSKIEIIIY